MKNTKDINDNVKNVKNKKNIMQMVMLTGTKFKKILFLVMFTFAVFVLMLTLNFSFNYLNRRFNLKFDVSNGKVYSLSPQVKDYLKNYDRKIKFVFFTDEHAMGDFCCGRLLDVLPETIHEIVALNSNFKFEDVVSKDKLDKKREYFSKVEILNTDDGSGRQKGSNTMVLMVDETDEDHLKGFTLDVYNIFSGADKYEDVSDVNKVDNKCAKNYIDKGCCVLQRQLVGMLEKFSQKNLIKVATTTGHGEFDYRLNLRFFDDMGVGMEKLDLNSADISSKCDFVLVAAPTKDFSEQEIEKLNSYLNDGGKLVVCASAAQGELPNFDNFLKKFGFVFSQGCVIDSEKTSAGPYVGIDLSSVENDYTKNMIDRKYPVVCEGCRLMKMEAAQDGWNNFEICRTPKSCVVVEKTTKGLENLPKSDFVFACGAQKKVSDEKTSKVVALSSVDLCEGPFSSSGAHNKMIYGGGKLSNVLLSNGDFVQSLFKEVSGKPGINYVPLKFVERSVDFVIYDEPGSKFKLLKIYTAVMTFGFMFVFCAIAVVLWILRRRKK